MNVDGSYSLTPLTRSAVAQIKLAKVWLFAFFLPDAPSQRRSPLPFLPICSFLTHREDDVHSAGLDPSPLFFSYTR